MIHQGGSPTYYSILFLLLLFHLSTLCLCAESLKDAESLVEIGSKTGDPAPEPNNIAYGPYNRWYVRQLNKLTLESVVELINATADPKELDLIYSIYVQRLAKAQTSDLCQVVEHIPRYEKFAVATIFRLTSRTTDSWPQSTIDKLVHYYNNLPAEDELKSLCYRAIVEKCRNLTPTEVTRIIELSSKKGNLRLALSRQLQEKAVQEHAGDAEKFIQEIIKATESIPPDKKTIAAATTKLDALPYNHSLDQMAKDLAKQEVLEARGAIDKKDYSIAYERAKWAYKHDPSSADAVWFLACSEYHIGDIAAMKKHSIEAITLDPVASDAWAMLALAYASSGEGEKATGCWVREYQLSTDKELTIKRIKAEAGGTTKTADPAKAALALIARLK